MNSLKAELKIHLENVKAMLEAPDKYLENYFSDLRVEIDIIYTKNETNETDQLKKNEISKNWNNLKLKLNDFQSDCLQTTNRSSFCDSSFIENINKELQLIESIITSIRDYNKGSKMKQEITDSIEKIEYEMQKILFKNKSIIFIRNFIPSDSKLLIINNNFIHKNSVLLLNNRFYKCNRLSNDFIFDLMVKMEIENTLNENLNKSHLVEIELKSVYNREILQSADSTNRDLFEKCTELDFRFKDILTIESNTFKSLTNLTSLYLNGNPLRFINKMVFLGLVNLKILELANTSLTAIDKDLFSCLFSLEMLDLSDNQISNLDKQTFKLLQNLKSLSLSNNQMTSIQETLFDDLVNLKYCYLSSNQLVSIDKNTFNRSKNLTVLYLNKNKIETIGIKIFLNLVNLEKLTLAENELTLIDSNLFMNLANLNYLDLSSNRLVSVHENAFDYLTNLKYLNLSKNKLTSIGSLLFARLFDLNFFEGSDLDILHIR